MKFKMYEEAGGYLCTQGSMEGEGFKYICESLLKESQRYHRKQWEMGYILDMLNKHDKLDKGLGFGCGREVIVPVFAAMGINLTVTDLGFEEAKSKGWVTTDQHSSGLEDFIRFCPNVCTEDQLKGLTYRTVNMNDIPLDLVDFDFCWSACSLEHVGSLEKAKRFIYNTLRWL